MSAITANKAMDTIWQSALDYYRLYAIRRTIFWISRHGLATIEERLANDVNYLALSGYHGVATNPASTYVHYAARLAGTSNGDADETTATYRELITRLADNPEPQSQHALLKVLNDYPCQLSLQSLIQLWHNLFEQNPSAAVDVFRSLGINFPWLNGQDFAADTPARRAALLYWAALSPAPGQDSESAVDTFVSVSKRIRTDGAIADMPIAELTPLLLGFLLRQLPYKPELLLGLLKQHESEADYPDLLKTTLLTGDAALQKPLIELTESQPEHGLPLLWQLGYPAVAECALHYLGHTQWATLAAQAWHGITGQLLNERIQLQSINSSAGAGPLVPDAGMAHQWWAQQKVLWPQDQRHLVGRSVGQPISQQDKAWMLQVLKTTAGAQTATLLHALGRQYGVPVALSEMSASQTLLAGLKPYDSQANHTLSPIEVR